MGARAKKSVVNPNTNEVQKPSIPVADRSSDNPLDMLEELSNLVSDEKPAATKRPEMKLSPTAHETFARFAPAKILADHFSAFAKGEKSVLNDLLMEEYIDEVFRLKAQPTNPTIQVLKDAKVDISGLYAVTERYKVNIPESNKKPAEAVVDLLVDGGVNEQSAKKLVATELSFTPKTGVRDFNYLTEGHKEKKDFIKPTEDEKSAGKKLLEWVLKSPDLTPEERKALIYKTPNARVNSGFLQRVTTYVDNVEQLRTILRVVSPTPQVRSVKFGVSDDLEGRNQRLIEVASTILGTDVEVEDSDD